MLHLSAFHRIHCEHLSSTNLFASSLVAKSNPISGTVISTYNQSDGIGQIGRTWYSDIGKNITSSLIVYPHFVPIDRQFYLSMAISLAVRNCLSDLLKQPVYVKWPNDIYVNDSKIAGILLQTSLQGKIMKSAIIGLGINVNQSSFPSLLPNPISLSLLCHKEWDIEKIWEVIEMNIRIYYNLLAKGRYRQVHNLYEQNLYKKNEVQSLTTTSGKKYLGMIVGVNKKGQLKFSENNKLHLFNLHEVRFSSSSNSV